MLIDEVKTVLRVTTDDVSIVNEIDGYIESAKLDLTKTADIKEFDEPDDFVKTAIFTYVKAMWTRDTNEADRLMRAYENMKATMLMSSQWGTFGGGSDGLNEED